MVEPWNPKKAVNKRNKCEDFENVLSDLKNTKKIFEDEFVRREKWSATNQHRKLDIIRKQLFEAGLSLLKNIEEPLTDESRNLRCNSKRVIEDTYEKIIKPTIKTLRKIWQEVIVIFDRVDSQENIKKQILEKRNEIISIEEEKPWWWKRRVKKINEEIEAAIQKFNAEKGYTKLSHSFRFYVKDIMKKSEAIADEIKENITEKIRDEYRNAIPLRALSQANLEDTLDKTLNFVQNQSNQRREIEKNLLFSDFHPPKAGALAREEQYNFKTLINLYTRAANILMEDNLANISDFKIISHLK